MKKFATLSPAELRSFYDRFGRKQDSQAFYEEPALRELVAHADFAQAHSVFELGCGTGRFAAQLLERHLPADAHYSGVDVSATMVELARQRLARFGARAEVQQTDGAPILAPATASIDRFVSTYVLDLLSRDDIAALLSEARRVLAPEGLLCLSSLTWGINLPSRFVIRIWTALHHLRPSLVGGCRPLELHSLLDASEWNVRHVGRVAPFGVPSEIVVAART
jgi:ubiquinone/menaquinone biosynthesis C-methylase UbiE